MEFQGVACYLHHHRVSDEKRRVCPPNFDCVSISYFHFCLQMDIIRTPKTLNKMASINLLRIRRRRTPMMNNSQAVNCKMAGKNIRSGKQVFLMVSLITGLIGVIFCCETCLMRTWSTSRRRKYQRF